MQVTRHICVRTSRTSKSYLNQVWNSQTKSELSFYVKINKIKLNFFRLYLLIFLHHPCSSPPNFRKLGSWVLQRHNPVVPASTRTQGSGGSWQVPKDPCCLYRLFHHLFNYIYIFTPSIRIVLASSHHLIHYVFNIITLSVKHVTEIFVL